jgi:hypothetical protein
MNALEQTPEREPCDSVDQLLQLLAEMKGSLDRVTLDFDKVQAIPPTIPCIHYCTEFRSQLLHQKRMIEHLYQMCGDCPKMINFRLQHHPEKHLQQTLENPRGKSVIVELSHTLLEIADAHHVLDALKVPRRDQHGVPYRLRARIHQLAQPVSSSKHPSLETASS